MITPGLTEIVLNETVSISARAFRPPLYPAEQLTTSLTLIGSFARDVNESEWSLQSSKG